jgi:anthranilate synthase component 1
MVGISFSGHDADGIARFVVVTPSLETFSKKAAEGARMPLRRRVPADLETPVSAFLRLKRTGAAFLLESVERGIQVGRYSFIGISPYARLSLQNDAVEISRGAVREVHRLEGADPLLYVKRELQRARIEHDADLPGPFGGAVGYLSYDVARYFEVLPAIPHDPLGLPDYVFIFPSALVVFDHVTCEIEIAVLPRVGDPRGEYERALAQIDAICVALSTPLPIRSGPDAKLQIGRIRDASSNVSREEFESRVERAKDFIRAGDAFQIVLSQRLEGETDVDPFQIYRALRILNPSPYMFYIDFGEFQLIGSSPEALVRLEGRRASLSPIAGTRPRGATPAEDDSLEAELRSSEKERAEHVMLVDLGRNDLGRVCGPGSVATESLMHVEKYSHVMHLVSRITGTLVEGRDMFDLLRAAFPAGTLTGAPKIRAMEIIAELEGEKRGPYGGAVGYFNPRGDMDMCITIRTIVMKGTKYYAQAGAGIVADSSPKAEFFETLDKIKALEKARNRAENGL